LGNWFLVLLGQRQGRTQIFLEGVHCCLARGKLIKNFLS
jgi:hypothetical protein